MDPKRAVPAVSGICQIIINNSDQYRSLENSAGRGSSFASKPSQCVAFTTVGSTVQANFTKKKFPVFCGSLVDLGSGESDRDRSWTDQAYSSQTSQPYN